MPEIQEHHLDEWKKVHLKKQSTHSGTTYAALKEKFDKTEDESVASLDLENKSCQQGPNSYMIQDTCTSTLLWVILLVKLSNPCHGLMLSADRTVLC